MGRIDTFPGLVAAAPFVGVKAIRSAAYNVPNAADTALPWDIEEFDSHGFHDNVTQNTRLTVPAGFEGYYHVGACWSSTAPSVDQRRHILTIKKNGTTLKGMASEHSTSGSQAYSGPMSSGAVYLVAGDYVEAFAYQDSGGVLALDTAKAGFWLYRVAEVAPAGASGMWSDYTPTLTQSGAVTKTVTSARYTQIGQLVVVQVTLTVTGSGTGSNEILVGLPVASKITTAATIGAGLIFDSSASFIYRAVVNVTSATTVRLESTEVHTGGGLGLTQMTAALASGDLIEFSATYEAA
jgi:hypothetical protein